MKGKTVSPKKAKTAGNTSSRKTDLTDKQKRLVKHLAQGMPRSEAAVAAGYSPTLARQSAYQALESVKKKTPEIMEELGLDIRFVIDKHLRPLLSSKEVVTATHEGEITDEKFYPANGVRLQATRTALELLNAFPPKDPAVAAQMGVEVVVVDIPGGVGVEPENPNSKRAVRVKVTQQEAPEQEEEMFPPLDDPPLERIEDDPRPRD